MGAMTDASAPATPKPTDTLVAAWTRTRDVLKAAGVASPAYDARQLVEAAVGVVRLDILTDPYRQVAPEAGARLDALAARRAGREPLAYILGHAAFWSLDFAVGPAVLTPRPDSETVVHAALAALPEDASARVLDLGTGSGILLLSILHARPLAEGVGIDASPAALAVARANAVALGLENRAGFAASDWGAGLAGPFDLVVSNPPYIATAEIDGLDPEVAVHEPRMALDGGDDGLDAYRRLMPDVFRLLAPGGRFALEIGQGQGDAVIAIARAAGLEPELVRPDLTGIGRVVVGARPLADTPEAVGREKEVGGLRPPR